MHRLNTHSCAKNQSTHLQPSGLVGAPNLPLMLMQVRMGSELEELSLDDSARVPTNGCTEQRMVDGLC